MDRRALSFRIVFAAVAAAGLALLAAPAATAATATEQAAGTCRVTLRSANWRAVFAHEPSIAAARADVRELVAKGFTLAKVEARGCGDYAVVVESPLFSRYPVRASFAAEARKAKLVVSFAAPATSVPRPGDVNVVFGHRATLASAFALLLRVAGVGWQEADVTYGGPRDWRVVWPNVPGPAADATVRPATAAGFAVELVLAAEEAA